MDIFSAQLRKNLAQLAEAKVWQKIIYNLELSWACLALSFALLSSAC